VDDFGALGVFELFRKSAAEAIGRAKWTDGEVEIGGELERRCTVADSTPAKRHPATVSADSSSLPFPFSSFSQVTISISLLPFFLKSDIRNEVGGTVNPELKSTRQAKFPPPIRLQPPTV
ncbi:hypothetical protein LINPERPRIM_LOCUS33747, partial [Linum perenne]